MKTVLSLGALAGVGVLLWFVVRALLRKPPKGDEEE